MGYSLLSINLFRTNPNIKTIALPVIIGLIIKSNEADPIITIIGFPPAGGWVTPTKIIKKIPIPTASGIIMKIGKGTKFTKNIPTKAVKKCPKKIFFGWANGLSGYPNNKTIVDPKDATRNKPNSVLYVNSVRHPIVIIEKIPAMRAFLNSRFFIKIHTTLI